MPKAECDGYIIEVEMDGPPVGAPDDAPDRPQINLVAPDGRWIVCVNDDGDSLDLRVYTRDSDGPVYNATVPIPFQSSSSSDGGRYQD